MAVQAQQKKYVYEDTTVVAPPASDNDEDYYPDDDVKTVVEAPPTTEEEATAGPDVDTTLYPNGVLIASDTAGNLKNKGELAYTRYLDSLLRAAQDKQKKEEPQKDKVNLKPPSLELGFLTPVLWVLGIGFVAFILYTLFLKDGAFRRASRKIDPITEATQQEELSPGTDMDRLIRQALQNRNFRLAIRYQYLNCLYKLAEKGLVQFAVDKTNYQYVSELTNQQQRNEFAKLTLHYEYVWYGEFEIDDVMYQKIEPGFTAFYNKI